MAAVVLLAFLAPCTARSAGHALVDQGARAMGTGLTGVAMLDTPEAVFYNPAGLTDLRDWQVSGGLAELALDISSEPAESAGTKFTSARDSFHLPHLYLTRGPKASGRWAFGLGLNAPFGLATEWPADFPGRFISRIADLKTLQLSLAAAVKLPRGWSVGFGPTLLHGDVRLVRDVDLSIFRRGHSAEADLTGDGFVASYRVGARWRGEKGWRFGTMVQGGSDLELDGKIDYSVVPLGSFSLDEAINTLFQDGDAGTSLPLPMTIWAGVGRTRGSWTWEIAGTWTDWSQMQSVIIDLDPIVVGTESLVVEEFLTPTWHDTLAWRAGLRHRVSPRWAWSAGLTLDESPVPARTADPLLPDSDRVLFSGGVSYERSRFALDAAAQVIRFEALDTADTGNEFDARYSTSALALGLTASWRF